MKKFMNNVDEILTESLRGFASAYQAMELTLLDNEMAAYWDAPVHTAALRWRC